MIPQDITETKTKNILMLHSVSDIYGASRILLITAKLLHAKKHSVHIVISEEGPLSDSLRQAGIKVTIIRLGILRKKYFSPKGMLNRLVVLRNARRELIKMVRNEQIDIVYSNTAMVLVGGFVARHCKVKHIWHIHEITERPVFFKRFLGEMMKRNSDMIITVSDEVKKHWSKYVSTDKMTTIHNGLDYAPYVNSGSSIKEELNIKGNEVLIGMIGRVNSWKGHGYFMEMTSLLTKKFPQARFLLVGDAYKGEDYLVDELLDNISKEDLGDVVKYLGFRADVANVLKGLDIFILPSILPDPLPTTVLEAMACGRPVIATQHGGALEMVDNHNTGVLIPWDDPEVAVERFSYLINDYGARKKMGDAGLNRVLTMFSGEQYEHKILETIDNL